MTAYTTYAPTVLEPHYSAHVNAMTTASLHTTSDIACQLALRDLCIKHLEKQRRVLGREVDRQTLVIKRMVQQASHQSERVRYLESKLFTKGKPNG